MDIINLYLDLYLDFIKEIVLVIIIILSHSPIIRESIIIGHFQSDSQNKKSQWV